MRGKKINTINDQDKKCQSYSLTPPAELHSWLIFPGSFMQKCRESGINDPTVQVIQQKWRRSDHFARKKLKLKFRASVWTRDVLIKSESQQWMFARSIMPFSSLKGTGRLLKRLKNKPLGEVLFSHPKMHRGQFELNYMTPIALKKEFKCSANTNVWARNSIFTLNEKQLLLTEVFLPDFTKWVETRNKKMSNNQ